MGIWQAMEMLNTLVDESDPDVRFPDLENCHGALTENVSLSLQTSLSQMEHLLQTAEAIRGDGRPEWMQVRWILIKLI